MFKKVRESENQGFVNYMRRSKPRRSIEGVEGVGSRRGSFNKVIQEGVQSSRRIPKRGTNIGKIKSTDKNGPRGNKALTL
jgi:hypothetical protein